MRSLAIIAAAVAATTAASPLPSKDLLAFRASPVGLRLAALTHEPILTMPLSADELVVAIYAPEQGALSRWDDETRIVLYRRVPGDFERIQFLSKASESLPGRGVELLAQDLNGDGVNEVLALGRPHGSVGKSTFMVFHRPTVAKSFGVIFRRRHKLPAFKVGPAPRLLYTYEAGEQVRHFETFELKDGYFQAPDGVARPILHE